MNPIIQIENAKSDVCTVRVGPIAREDPDAEIQLIVERSPGTWERVIRRFVSGQKVHKFPGLKEGNYHVMVVGDKIAGIATTAGHVVPFPFNVLLDPIREHSKDFMKLSIPTGEPVPPSLAESIRASFKEKEK